MYAEFDEIEYAKLRRSLIRKSARGSSAQRDFLEAVGDTAAFLSYLQDSVPVLDGEDLSPLAERMSEAEFGNPPVGHGEAPL